MRSRVTRKFQEIRFPKRGGRLTGVSVQRWEHTRELKVAKWSQSWITLRVMCLFLPPCSSLGSEVSVVTPFEAYSSNSHRYKQAADNSDYMKANPYRITGTTVIGGAHRVVGYLLEYELQARKP